MATPTHTENTTAKPGAGGGDDGGGGRGYSAVLECGGCRVELRGRVGVCLHAILNLRKEDQEGGSLLNLPFGMRFCHVFVRAAFVWSYHSYRRYDSLAVP